MLRLASVFSDHMVLQRQKPIRLFGEADGPVTVSLNGETVTAEPKHGRFVAVLPPMEAGGPYTLTAVCGDASAEITDVWLGEVWMCGGQSNMEFRLREDADAEVQMAKGHDERIRFYTVPQAARIEEAERMERNAAWVVLRPGACAEVSAAAYYAARRMAEALDVPVGMIICCIGGSSVSCWMDEGTLSSFPVGRAYLADFEARVAGKSDAQYDREQRDYMDRVNAYMAAMEGLKSETPDIDHLGIVARIGDYPWPPPDGRWMLLRPVGPFETMVRRITPIALRGFLYYQGEADAPRAWAPGYAESFTRLIDCWRRAFDDADLWFLAVQLTNYGADDALDDWPAIREAQKAVCDADPHAALACIIDCGDSANIHPLDKHTPGTRLAGLALAHIFGRDIEADSPALADAALSEGCIMLRFARTGGGLTGSPEDVSVTGADVMGAAIEGDAIRLTIGPAEGPLTVHYAWTNDPKASLHGQNGLPVFPFRHTF